MHETWDEGELLRACSDTTRRDVAQRSLDSLSRQAEEMHAEREIHEALLRFSWICAACGWALFALKAAGCF